ncbi:MAG: hypothetical protein R3C53_09350 [Pirellulaceae bacterium]
MVNRLSVETTIAQTQQRIAPDLFPLPLTPFEKFVLWDETIDHPMTSSIRLIFESKLDFDVLQDAFAFAVHCHPLLASTLTTHQRQLCWNYDPQFRLKLLKSSETPILNAGRVRPFDLYSEPGIRVWCSTQDHESWIEIQLHHACCDGVGLRRALIDVFSYYAHHTVGPASKPSRHRIQIDALRERNDFSEVFAGEPLQKLSTWQRIKNAHYFHFQLPQPLLGSRSGSVEELPSPLDNEPAQHLRIDRESSQRILDRCRDEQLSVNNLAIALLFRTCCVWNEQRGESHPGSRMRVLMPYALQSRMDLRMPAANRLSFAFLGRRRAQCADLQALIASLDNELSEIRRTRLPLDFLSALQVATRHPRLLRWGLRRSRNMSTTVLTYAGDLMRGLGKQFPKDGHSRLMGDARLVSILAAPPVRENTNISLGLCVNWGELSLSALWNRQVFSAQDCRDFLELYQQNWLNWLD